MGVLILSDTIAVRNTDLSPEHNAHIAEYRMSSTRAVVNLINLVLQMDMHSDGPSSSLLLKDPYPEHASNCFSRAAHSVLFLFHTNLLTQQVASFMAATLFSGLEIVSQISYSAGEHLAGLRVLYQKNNLNVKHIKPLHFPPHAAETVMTIASDSHVTPGMLEDETVKELGYQASADPALVTKTIERHEVIPDHMMFDFGLDYLPWIDSDLLTQEWDFEDCFSNM